MKKDTIDPKVYDLYDEYCHSQMTRREFFNKASALAVVGGTALAMDSLPSGATPETTTMEKSCNGLWIEINSFRTCSTVPGF